MSYKNFQCVAWRILFLVFLGSLSSFVFADEIVDDITVRTEANGDVVAEVKFAYPIQYLRHFPDGKSSFVTIFFNVLSSVPSDVWQDYETHRTPPSDLIQEITVSTRDLGTGPKVQIKFNRPVEYTVTMSNSQILLIRIKPVILQKKNESKPVSGKPVAMLPVAAASTSAYTPTITAAARNVAAAGCKVGILVS